MIFSCSRVLLQAFVHPCSGFLSYVYDLLTKFVAPLCRIESGRPCAKKNVNRCFLSAVMFTHYTVVSEVHAFLDCLRRTAMVFHMRDIFMWLLLACTVYQCFGGLGVFIRRTYIHMGSGEVQPRILKLWSQFVSVILRLYVHRCWLSAEVSTCCRCVPHSL